MSCDVYVGAHLGWRIKLSEFLAKFRRHEEAKFHMEPRYDFRTGERIEDEKVIDSPAQDFFQVGDDRINSFEEFLKYVHEKTGTDVSWDKDLDYFYVYVPLKDVGKKEYCGMMTKYPDLAVPQNISEILQDIRGKFFNVCDHELHQCMVMPWYDVSC